MGIPKPRLLRVFLGKQTEHIDKSDLNILQFFGNYDIINQNLGQDDTKVWRLEYLIQIAII